MSYPGSEHEFHDYSFSLVNPDENHDDEMFDQGSEYQLSDYSLSLGNLNLDENVNKARIFGLEGKQRLVGKRCCCCNAVLGAVGGVVEFQKCRHVFHESCLKDQENYPHSPRCWVCSGRLAPAYFGNTALYIYKLQWSQNWEAVYGNLLVWMEQHLEDKVGSVQINVDESFRAYNCRLVGAATFKAFVLNPFSSGIRSLTALLDRQLYEDLERVVDALYDSTLIAGAKKLSIESCQDSIFDVVDKILQEDERHFETVQSNRSDIDKCRFDFAAKIQSLKK